VNETENPPEAPDAAPDEEGTTFQRPDPPEAPDEPAGPTPDEEEEAHDAEEAEAPPPEAQGTTPEEWEARFKKADRSFKTYSRNVEEAWAEDALGLVAFTASPSAPPGYLHMQDAGRVEPEVRAMLMDWLGFPREQDYADDPATETCATCGGKGRTKTGSKVAGQETRTCVACGGRGFIETGANGSARAGVAVITATETHTPLDDLPKPDVDMFGESKVLPDGRLNPNYGKSPQYKELVEPWGITAGLTAQDHAPSTVS